MSCKRKGDRSDERPWLIRDLRFCVIDFRARDAVGWTGEKTAGWSPELLMKVKNVGAVAFHQTPEGCLHS